MNIAIFASGGGSNAEIIIKTLPQLLQENNINAKIALIVTNNVKAGVTDVALKKQVPLELINVLNVHEPDLTSAYLSILKKHKIGFIILAGYLKKIPLEVIKAFPNKIINIHPALLPAYGGAGMYGIRIHEAVVNAGEKHSGITIHFVDEVYDNGKIIFQASCNIEENETAISLSKKILKLEHTYYSPTIVNTIIGLM